MSWVICNNTSLSPCSRTLLAIDCRHCGTHNIIGGTPSENCTKLLTSDLCYSSTITKWIIYLCDLTIPLWFGQFLTIYWYASGVTRRLKINSVRLVAQASRKIYHPSKYKSSRLRPKALVTVEAVVWNSCDSCSKPLATLPTPSLASVDISSMSRHCGANDAIFLIFDSATCTILAVFCRRDLRSVHVFRPFILQPAFHCHWCVKLANRLKWLK